MVTAVSVVRDFSLYRRCLRENPKCGNMEFIALDNTAINEPIPVRYNRFLNDLDDLGDSWLVFCHEDFEPQESLEKKIEELALDEHALYGPIGCRRKEFAGFGMQVYCGEIDECKREDASEPWKVGRPIAAPVEVETFDCCCLLVHSSLIRQHGLRFDEELQFDLYVEDFCAAARLHHGIKSFAIPFKACHHSGSAPTERLYRHLPYLKQKYPHDCFTATCTYFGTPSWQKRLQDFMLAIVR